MLSLLLTCCSPRIAGQLHTSDTVYVSKTDSLYLRDSIYVDRWRESTQRGDTVWVTEVRTEYRDRWRYRDRTDTVYVDKVREEVIVQEVERKITKFEKFQRSAFWILAGALLGALALTVWRLWKRIKR